MAKWYRTNAFNIGQDYFCIMTFRSAIHHWTTFGKFSGLNFPNYEPLAQLVAATPF